MFFESGSVVLETDFGLGLKKGLRTVFGGPAIEFSTGMTPAGAAKGLIP
jgi:hypothetical protein